MTSFLFVRKKFTLELIRLLCGWTMIDPIIADTGAVQIGHNAFSRNSIGFANQILSLIVWQDLGIAVALLIPV